MFTRRPWEIFVLLLFGCFAPWAALQSAVGDGPRSLQVDPELRQRFREAFAEDFEFGDDRLQGGPQGGFWLVGMRPKQAGFYVVGFEFRCDVDPPHYNSPLQIQYDRTRYQFILAIGEKGAPRSFSGIRSVTYLACVGDTVVIPVPVAGAYYDYQFFKTPTNAWQVSDCEERVKKYEDSFERLFPESQDDSNVDVEMKSQHVEFLIGRHVQLPCVRRGLMSHSINALVRATMPGLVNLNPIYTENRERYSPRTVPLLIVPSDAPLTVLATKADRTEFSGEPPQQFTYGSTFDILPYDAPTALRVGDRISVSCWNVNCVAEVQLPPVSIEDGPFKGSWPLRITPDAPNPLAPRP